METVEIQKYLDSQWQAYQELNPNDEDCPVQVKKARWARENYYYLLQSFLQRRTLDSNTFAHRTQDGIFVPLIPLSSVSTEESKQQATDAVQLMKDDDIEEVDKVLWEAWKSYFIRFGTTGGDKYACFSAFLKEEYFHILKYKYPSTKPRVPPKTNASPDEVTQRHHRLKTMSSKDLEDVDIMVTTQWNKERSGLPQSLQAMLPVEPTQKYWEQNYYPCLDKVYTKKVPRVDPKHNATAELVESRRMLFDSLSVENIHILDEAVQKLWNAERNTVPQAIRFELPQEPPEQILDRPLLPNND